MSEIVRNGFEILGFITRKVLSEGEVQMVRDGEVDLGR